MNSQSETYEELELSSRNLVLPEAEQFKLGAKLFSQKDKMLAAWKAYQTFLYNYPKSKLAGDAQFMLAESIFRKATQELESGNPPDEAAWRKRKKGGFKKFGRGLRKGFGKLKDLGAAISGEPVEAKNIERIDIASFSEAIKQYKKVINDYKKSALSDTAMYRMAESYYNMGDYPTALNHFKKLQKRYPNSYLVGESILGAAQCYIPGGDFGSAELEMRRLMTTYPSYKKNPQVQFITGIILFQEGKYQEAAENLEKINSAEALFYAGQSLVNLGKSLAATAKFKKIIREYKDSRFAEQSAYLIGDAFFQSKNYTGAIQEFKTFLRLYPRSDLREAALYKVGASYFLKKDYPSARGNFNLLLNTYPAGEYVSLARYFIAESYRMAGQLKEASFSYGQLISVMPNAPITANARFKLAWVTYVQKNYNDASTGFQKFIDWHPFHAWVSAAYVLMGNCYANLGKFEQSVHDYQQAFDRAKNTEMGEAAMALLNRTRYSQGSYGQLTSGYTYILKSLTPSESKWRAYSQLYLADSYYRQKLYNEAISVFLSVTTLYPNLPVTVQARDGLSWCYFQLGDYAKAQKEREQIKTVQLPEGVDRPPITTSTYELANAFFNQKKYDQALENYSKFIQESPESPDVPEAIYRMGLCYFRQEYYSQAIKTWTDLEARYPKHERSEEGVFQIADTYFRAGKYNESIQTYRKIVTRFPKNPKISEATLRIGQSYYNAGDDKNAVAELENFLRKFPEDEKSVDTLNLLEAALDRQIANKSANKQKVISVLAGLNKSFPRTDLGAEAQYRIAVKYFNWKDFAKSSKEFSKLTVNYPESTHIAEALFYEGESYYSIKKYKEAIVVYNRFINNFPKAEYAPAVWFHLGTSQFNLQKFNDAIASFQSLLREHPGSEFASAGLNNLALSQKKMRKLTEAADSYTKLALNYPDDAYASDALLEAAKLNIELKKYQEAILTLRDLESKFPGNDERRFEVISLIGESYVASNDPGEAIKAFNQLVSVAGSNPGWQLEAYRQLGAIYEGQKEWGQAATIYEKGGRTKGDAAVSKSFRERAKYIRQNYLSGQKTTGQGQ